MSEPARITPSIRSAVLLVKPTVFLLPLLGLALGIDCRWPRRFAVAQAGG